MNAKQLAIRVEGLSKLYRIGVRESAHENLASAIFGFLKSPIRNYRKYRSLYDFRDIISYEKSAESRCSDDVIWALKDVSFDIQTGEVVGVIGKNGAGKSTLLKILARITPPTTGRAEIRGRVSSLLEVGTGFHQELTGRENVYLNGTILGMRKREVDKKFDEIVEFSGIDKFLDTPVKRYSSGMRVRLAFAVAAHLEPEILIIDEVLAVGDAAFQKKCIHKMQDVGKQGRAVLFVSHNMQAVTRLCERAVMLDGGRIVYDGSAPDVVGHYLNAGLGLSAKREWKEENERPGGEVARLCAVRITDEDRKVSEAVDITQPVKVEMEYEVVASGYQLVPHFHVFNEEGVHVFVTIEQDSAWHGRARPAGKYVSTATIPGNLLAEGMLYVTPALVTVDPNIPQFYERDAVAFQVIETGIGRSARGDYTRRLGGVVRPLLRWHTELQS